MAKYNGEAGPLRVAAIPKRGAAAARQQCRRHYTQRRARGLDWGNQDKREVG